MKKIKQVTMGDILLSEGRSNGYGLFGHDVRRPAFWVAAPDPYAVVKVIDQTVAYFANQRKWDAQKTFEFMNSKLGRWAGDEISSIEGGDPSDEQIAFILDKYMKSSKP
jgi:hypothetical protein